MLSNKLPPQTLMRIAGIDVNTYNQVMANIQGKTPEQVHEYTENLYKSQRQNIQLARQNIINRLNQFGLNL